MFLRQSTTQTIRFGPFLDSTDGVTAETALTIAQADRQISKDGGAFAQSNHTGNSTHDTDGWYSDDLNATDTNTVGELILQVVVTGSLPVWFRYWVIEESIYDAVYGASAAGFDSNQRVDVGEWLGNAVTASSGNPDVNIESIDAGVIASGSFAANAINAAALATDAVNEIADGVWDEAMSGHTTLGSFGQALNALGARTGAVNDAGATTTDFDVDGFTEATNDHLNGMIMVFTSGNLLGQANTITDYNGTGQNCIFGEPWTEAPANNDEFVIVPGLIPGGTLAQVLRLFITVLNQSTGQLDSGSLTGGTIDAAAIAANAIGASELATDAVNEIRDAILSDSTAFAGANIDAAISTRATPAQVNTEVDTALADVNLDHLVGTATGIPAIPAGTYIDQMMDDGTATFDRTTDSLQAIRDRGDAAWTTGAGSGLTPLASGTAQGGTASTIQLASGETFADDELIGNSVKITSGTGAGQSRVVTDNVGSTDTLTVSPNWITNPDATSVYEIVQGSVNLTVIQGDAQSATDLKDFADAGYDPGTNQVEGVKLVDTTTTNSDMRGTDNAALASVLGALADAAAAGDPTATDTVIAYVKQLVNVLVGTTGVTTFPAEAAPANNVSLAEVIRAIHSDVTGLNGDAMRGTDNAALASVVGALSDAAAAGDPTVSDTVIAYIKQLINTLEGTTGIPTFPASATPANNVSLAEILRQVYDEVAGLDGAAMRGTDGANTTTPPTAASIADAVWDEDATAHQTQGTFGQAIGDPGADTDTIFGLVNTNLDATVGSRASQTTADAIETDTQNIQSRLPAALVSGKMDSDAVAISGSTVAADNVEANIGNLDAAVSNVETDTQDIQSRLPSALVGGRMDSNVGAVSGSAGAADKMEESFEAVITGSVGSGSTTTTIVISSTNPTLTVNDQVNGKIVTFTDATTTAALRGQSTDITDYVQSTATMTVTALTTAPVSGDTFVIT